MTPLVLTTHENGTQSLAVRWNEGESVRAVAATFVTGDQPEAVAELLQALARSIYARVQKIKNDK